MKSKRSRNRMNKRRKNDLREQRRNRWDADEVETMQKKNITWGNPVEKVISESQDDSVDSIDNDTMKTEGWRPRPGEPSIKEKKKSFSRRCLVKILTLVKRKKPSGRKCVGLNLTVIMMMIMDHIIHLMMILTL